jgi:nicotinamide mononucleotide adenylyltransferase
MGGVAGHMDHLYENRDLTFGEMKQILEAAANGELTAEEKVDGQNLFLSYSIPEGKAKGARNKGNLKSGGLDAVGLAQKFAGRGGLEKAFSGGFATFEKAVEALSDEEKERIFGPNTNIWYNAEVMDPGNANVILYDDKTLKIHDVGHFVFDRETGDQSPIPRGTLETLDNALERMENQLHSDDFNLARRALVDIKKIEDDGQALNQAFNRINNEMRKEGLNDDSTILDYMYKRLMNGIDSELPKNLKEEIINYILKLPGNIGLRALKKGLNPQDLQDLNSIIAGSKVLLQQSVEPLELAIHDFTVELLKGLKSIFIEDNDKEVMRLKNELANAVKEITSVGTENPEAMAVMQRHLNKIKDFSTITTPVEAVVFDYNGHTYKFAGNFAPLNQILGMFRYGNLKRSTKESLVVDKPIITEKENNIKRQEAEKFVLSLPKFTPSEAWGDPGSMERKQIQKIFDTVGGGATIREKLEFLNDSINNPTGGITAPRRIISTLILMESLAAVIRSFNSASAGFVFEGFLSALFRGRQEAEVSAKGNLPIQDLIAFSELGTDAEGNDRSVPVSLKLLSKATNIEGSYTNLIDALEEFGQMVYIVARKDKGKDNILLEQFTFTRDNFIDALTMSARGGGLSKEANLFKLPDNRKAAISIQRIKKMSDWSEQYEMLKLTAGYRQRKKAEPEIQPQEPEEPQETEETPEQEVAKESIIFTVEENRKMIAEGLLLESKGTQWQISPSQLSKLGDRVSLQDLGSLPISADRVVDVAEMYMKNLSTSIREVFAATAGLSDNINNYFTYSDRKDAISAGTQAVKDAEVVSQEMTQQVSKDKEAPAQRNESLNNTTQVITEKEGRRIALFPGKFKPPHRGHFDYVNKIAKRSDVDEVVIMISPVDYPEVSNAQSLRIWEEYLENGEPNITAKIADYRSPVQAVYEFVADPKSASDGDTVLLVKSSKDVGDTRFDRAQSYAERHNPGVNVEDIVEDPVQSKDGIVYSARDMRKAIAERDKETFLSYAPPSIDGEALWNSLIPQTERLNSVIDDTIDEMSAGGVGGYSLPLGMKPVYPNKTRSKTSRPKVRRAKRQRRR